MPRRIDLDRRREQLAEAVWATIRTSGIGAVSVRTVAAEAGVAVGSLRHVFPTRSELLQFSAELAVQRATARILTTVRSDDPLENALTALRHVLPLEEETRAELEVNIALIAEAPAVPELRPIRDHMAAQLELLCREIVTMLAPTLSDGRALVEAKRLHALLDGLALHMVAGPDEGESRWALSILEEELVRLRGL